MSLRTDAMLKSVRLAADLMKSLSNPNRLSIVCCLVHGERSVSDAGTPRAPPAHVVAAARGTS